jgi:hypothetical protein
MCRDAPFRVELLQETLDLLLLYPALHGLDVKGWIAPSWERSKNGSRASFDRLPPFWREPLADERSKWVFSRDMALILNPANQEAQ